MFREDFTSFHAAGGSQQENLEKTCQLDVQLPVLARWWAFHRRRTRTWSEDLRKYMLC